MNTPDDHMRNLRELYESMSSEQVAELQQAYSLDKAVATRAESIAFCAGRLALITSVLSARQ